MICEKCKGEIDKSKGEWITEYKSFPMNVKPQEDGRTFVADSREDDDRDDMDFIFHRPKAKMRKVFYHTRCKP